MADKKIIFSIHDIHVEVEGKEVVKGVSLDIRRGVKRKGVKKRMNENNQSKQIKARGRTYFLDIRKTKEGKTYLRITESHKGEGDKFERTSVNVFPEDAGEFAQAVSEMASKLGQEKSV